MFDFPHGQGVITTERDFALVQTKTNPDGNKSTKVRNARCVVQTL